MASLGTRLLTVSMLPRLSAFLKPRNYVTFVAYPRFSLMKLRTRGMLHPRVYASLYREARRLSDKPFVEIGAASGSATIALAWGYRDVGHVSRIVAVERCHSGSRSQYGGFSDNLAILTRNLEQHHVEDRVHLFTEALTAESARDLVGQHGLEAISGFMHDADGHLDRDFPIFWPLTEPGGLIVVDDYLTAEELASMTVSRHPALPKYKLTRTLLEILIDHRLFVPIGRVNHTCFGRKPDPAPDWPDGLSEHMAAAVD